MNLAPLKREGYPLIEDPEHPLWEQQQEGWPDFTPIEAKREAARDSVATRANSNSHPAFQSDYIVNDQAERERQQEEAAAPAKPRR